MELGRPGDDDVGFDGGGADRAQRGRGSSTTDRKICSTDSGGTCPRSRRAPAVAALNDQQNLPALLILAGLTRARDLLGPPGRCSGDGEVGGGAGGDFVLADCWWWIPGRRWSSGDPVMTTSASMVAAPIERSEVGGHRQQIGKSAALTVGALALARAGHRRSRH